MDSEGYLQGMLVGQQEVDQLAREALRTVRRNLERPRKALPAGMLVLARQGQLPPEPTVILLGEYTEEEKVERYRAAGAEFVGTGRVPVAAVLFSEAWMVSAKQQPDVEPRHHPDRKEVIVIGGGALGGVRDGQLFLAHQTAGFLHVSRDRHGRLVTGKFVGFSRGCEGHLLLQFFDGYACALMQRQDPERN